MLKNQYKVYLHICPNGKKYVGITGQEAKKRWHNGHGYKHCVLFYNAIKKYGWDNFEHIILYDELSKEEAELTEIDLIKKWNLLDDRFGYNLALGGNTSRPTDETKIKMRKSALGRIITQEQIEKRKKTMIGNPYKPSKEAIEKTAKSHFKRIYQFSFGGDVINEFESIDEAEKKTGICRVSISNCANNKIKKTGSYIWSFNSELDSSRIILTERIITMKNLNGEFIKEFKTLSEAADETGLSKKGICRTCLGNRETYKGFKWEYTERKLKV